MGDDGLAGTTGADTAWECRRPVTAIVSRCCVEGAVRYYYHSPLRWFIRIVAVFWLLFAVFSGVYYLLVYVLPALVPVAVPIAVIAGMGWMVRRLRS